ncbi:MAG: 16S rRNA (cytosine(1402)-N(4))-methyltransferase RsmH [bacterium]
MASPRGTDPGGTWHRPVLLEESIGLLAVREEGAYVDGTTGGGGHLARLLEVLGPGARVLGIDRDPQALEETRRRIGEDERVLLRQGPFGRLRETASEEGLFPLSGVFLDLGVSSRQLDEPEKGFTYRGDAPLDMRMDPSQQDTAADLLASVDEEELAEVLRAYGEVRRARALARAVVRTRKEEGPLTRSGELRRIVEELTPDRLRSKVLSQVFQALRIAVNDELTELSRALEGAVEALEPGGRLVVISYHSLEDRRVKHFMREAARGCTCPPDFPVCVCGAEPTLRLVSRGAVMPDDEEIESNPRARSARLRAAERTRGGDRA